VTPEFPAQPATLTAAQLKAEANRLGFSACAITSLEPLPHNEELDRWLASGKAGNMRYLHRQAKKRKNPQVVDKTARRAIVVLDSYYYESIEETTRPKVARYARGTDYHTVTRRRLELLADFLRHNGAQTARAYADSGPLAERELAQRAGLGWIGKNTMLIRPNQGSWMFIGTVLTDLELEIDSPFETDHCGSCTRCLDACPTQAFEGPRVLDATRCISYLTIEHRGPIPADLIDRFEGWAFGCDICNEVCPWNVRFATESSVPEFRPRASLDNAGPDFFEKLDEPAFAADFGDTPLQRPGLERMRRNWRAAWTSLKP
jgi:epoxyqueuosine reductase